MSDIPTTHPRYLSLLWRERIVAGVEGGITSLHGLIAHGRGEAYDYLIGECTCSFAQQALEAAAAMLVQAKFPVLSVNGNAAALVPNELVQLAQILDAPLEVNIFHASEVREKAIADQLYSHGASNILMPTDQAQLDFIDSNRRFVHPDGIKRADVVFVPLEDGDRCQALRGMGKEVVTVDLNPLSRTARQASITIVDNLVRAMPCLIKEVESLRGQCSKLSPIIEAYDNCQILVAAEQAMRNSG